MSRAPTRSRVDPLVLTAALGGLAITLAATATTVSVLGSAFGSRAALEALPEQLLVLPFTVVGALLVLRRPSQVTGWLLIGTGTAHAVVAALNAYTDAAFLSATGPGPFDPRLTLVANPLAMLGVVFGLVLVPALFPTGRSLTERWRWIPRVSAVVAATLVLTAPFTEDQLRVGPDGARVSLGPNPLMSLPGARLLQYLGTAAFIAVLGLVVAAFSSLVVRFRRATGVERHQLRWLRLGVGALLGMFVLVLALDQLLTGPVPEPVVDAMFGLGTAMVPASIWIAITRHGLYEIDRVVNRAVVYGTVSTILAATYAALVVGLQAMLPTGGSDLAVAGSTLAVAGLFRPLRGRIQRLVARRFSRTRYDAARTVDAFGQRLRNEVDLPVLLRDLQTVTAGTLGASSVGLWLPAAPGGRRPPGR